MAKAMIKNVRLSYVRLFEAQQVNGQGEASYSVCLLIPKDSPEVPKIKEAIEQEFRGLKARYPKLNGKDPKVEMVMDLNLDLLFLRHILDTQPNIEEQFKIVSHSIIEQLDSPKTPHYVL